MKRGRLPGFLEVFSSVVEQFDWVSYTYCLMSNYYHLLVKTPDANLSKGVRLFNGADTQAYNRRHQKTGQLFQGRYKSIWLTKIITCLNSTDISY
jgi:putative transposase